MASVKRSDDDESPRFVWEDRRPAAAPGPDSRVGPGKSGAGGRRVVSPARVLIAGAVAVALGAGTFGVVGFSSSGPASGDVAGGGPASSAGAAGASGQTASAGSSANPTSSFGSASAASSTSASRTPTAHARAVTAVTAATSAASVGPRPLAEWLLDGNALDSIGAHDGVASGISFSHGAAVLTGANSSYVATSSAVLNTGPGASFTVSAWVYLTAAPTSASAASTAVSQDAGINSAFYLQYFAGINDVADCWSFTRMDTDTVLSDSGRAESTSTPKFRIWTHLVGVYDASTSALYLYVNGRLEGTGKDATPFASSGPLVIGRARYNSQPSDAFAGEIKDVQVFDRALPASAIEALH